jgi:hypothetical protein
VDFARFHSERDTVEDRAILLGELHMQIFDFEHSYLDIWFRQTCSGDP